MELLNNCTYEWTTQNGVKGGLFTSKTNGKSIFFPAGGSWWDNNLNEVGKSGNYWSSSVRATPEEVLLYCISTMREQTLTIPLLALTAIISVPYVSKGTIF